MWIFCLQTGEGPAGQAGALRAVVLTKDHLAMYPEERARIDKAGGHVTGDGRLNGRMQVGETAAVRHGVSQCLKGLLWPGLPGLVWSDVVLSCLVWNRLVRPQQRHATAMLAA